MCISFIEAEEDAAYVGSKERFWIKKTRNKEKKILNPLIALNRTEKIVKTLFDMYGVDLPVQKLLISRNGFFDYPLQPYGVQFNWKTQFRGMVHDPERNEISIEAYAIKSSTGSFAILPDNLCKKAWVGEQAKERMINFNLINR